MTGEYVIWSFEHQQWWAPNERGYVVNLDRAGRYTRQDAGRIVIDSVFLDEVGMLYSEAVSQGPPNYHPYKGWVATDTQEGEKLNCPRCDGGGFAYGRDRPLVWLGPGTHPGPCPVCNGSGVTEERRAEQ